MSDTHHRPVSTTGGSDGIQAHCEDIRAMGARFGAAATDTLGSAWTLHGYLVHPALAASALFDPVGYARFEGELLGALDGLHGLSGVGARCGAIDGELRAAAAAYDDVDHLVGRLHDEVIGALDVPVALAVGAGLLTTGAGVNRAAQSALTADPGLADLAVDRLHLPPVVAALGTAMPDGHGVATALGTDRESTAGTPPRTLSDLVGELAHRDDDPHHGAIDVRVLTCPDGTRRAIVDITGTKTWTPLPTSDVTSLTTDGRALAGQRSAYEQGVLQAMRRAGVRRNDEVMMVGHSEGGMVAVTAARDAVRSGEFTVTHVVTAGSPIGRTASQLPSTVRVLALENSRDLVPHLDGVANPDQRNVTTVTGSRGDGSVLGDHSLTDAYGPLSRDAEAADNASVREFLRSAEPYLRASAVRTHVFQITRRYR